MMLKAILIIALVAGALIGGLMILRSTGSMGVPGGEVMDRAKKRAREQAAADEDADRGR
jgi:hypothetical protein